MAPLRPARLHPHLFEIAAWPWLERLSGRIGRPVTLADVPENDWDSLLAPGFDYVYLMGVWHRSPLGRAIAREHEDLRQEYDRVLPGWTPDDVPGSPFSMSAYEPDARMGGWPGLGAARAALHARGARLIVDFVPNHTGFDCPWVATHPERYVLGREQDLHASPSAFRRVGGAIVACGRDPLFPPWTDVAQLNYFNPETRSAMRGVLREIAAHADGVRCDMAMLLLDEVFERTWRPVLRDDWPALAEPFWPEAIAGAPLLYLAEVYWDLEWTLQQQGFHFTYDKRLLDRLLDGAAAPVRDHLGADAPFRDRLARFIENHDERRSADAFETRLAAAATAVAMLPGLRVFFDGQFDGARLRVPVQLGRWPVEPSDTAVRDLYRRLMGAAADDLFHAGEWRLLPVRSESADAPIAWEWRLEDQWALVVINPSAREAFGRVALNPASDDETWLFEDLLDDRQYLRARADLTTDGLPVVLAAGHAHLFRVRAATA